MFPRYATVRCAVYRPRKPPGLSPPHRPQRLLLRCALSADLQGGNARWRARRPRHRPWLGSHACFWYAPPPLVPRAPEAPLAPLRLRTRSPPRRLFLLSLTSVLNPSLSLSHVPRSRVSLTSVLNDMSSELDRKTSSSSDVDDAVELPLDVPPESTSDPRSWSDTSAMGSSPNASHSVTRRRLDRGSRLLGCSSRPCPARSSAASLPATRASS